MSSLSELKNGITKSLATQIKGVDFCTDYNSAEFLYSLKQPLVSIYLKGIRTNSGVMGDFLLNKADNSTSVSTYGKSVAIELGVQIFCSSTKGSVSCDDIFTTISEHMVINPTLDLQSITCSASQYLPKQEVFSQNASILINMMLADELHAQYVTDFTLQTTLDKTSNEN